MYACVRVREREVAYEREIVCVWCLCVCLRVRVCVCMGACERACIHAWVRACATTTAATRQDNNERMRQEKTKNKNATLSRLPRRLTHHLVASLFLSQKDATRKDKNKAGSDKKRQQHKDKLILLPCATTTELCATTTQGRAVKPVIASLTRAPGFRVRFRAWRFAHRASGFRV